MTTGILIAFCATVCWAVTAFLFTRAGRIMSAQTMNLFRLLLGVALVLLAAIIFDPNFFFIFSGQFVLGWLWLGLSGIIALGIGDYYGLRMYTILSPRYGSVLMTFAPAMTFLVGIILLNDHMNFIGLVGMLITIIGVATMSLGKKERGNILDQGQGSIYKGIAFGLISAICNGGALAFSKKGFIAQEQTGFVLHPITGSFIRFVCAVIVVLVFMTMRNMLFKNIKNLLIQPIQVLRIGALGIFLGPLLGVSFAMIAIQTVNVAVAQTIFSLVPVVALFISHFILKEKLTRNSLLGVIAAVAGVCLLIWRNEIANLSF